MSFAREVWRIDRGGSLDRLTKRSEPLADPCSGEARVRVKAVGLNFADVFACLGLYSATPKGSFVPGLEFAGVVDAVGPSTSCAFVAGDAVIGMIRFGAYATALNADVRALRRIPDEWSFAEAAAYPVQGLTAWYGLVQIGALSRGDVVLVHSAAGGVGLNALQILQAYDARVVATVGREEKREFLVTQAGLRAEQVIVRDRRSFGAQLERALESLNAKGFDLVFDAVAGPFLLPAYERLQPEGRLVVYGAADFMPPGARPNPLRLGLRYLRRPRIDPLQMMSENRSVMGFNLIWLWDQVDRLPRAYEALDRLIRTPPFVGRRFAFDEAPAAMRYLQSGESMGKVVLEVGCQ